MSEWAVIQAWNGSSLKPNGLNPNGKSRLLVCNSRKVQYMTYNKTAAILALTMGALVTFSSLRVLGADEAPQETIKKLPYTTAELLDPQGRYVYRAGRLDQAKFLLGGIGSGSISLSGRGALVDWQIFGKPNVGFQPDYTFLSLWAKPEGAASVFRVIEGPAPLHYSGKQQHGFGPPAETGAGLPHMRNAEFEGRFPFGAVRLTDPQMPLDVTIEAFSPFIPNNDRESSLPVAVLNVTLANRTQQPVRGALAMNMDNVCGSGAINQIVRRAGYYALSMSNPSDPAGNGFVVASTTPVTTWQPHWEKSTLLPSGGLQHFTETFVRHGRFDAAGPPVEAAEAIPSPVRPDYVLEDFENGTYDRWQVEGKAFLNRPTTREEIQHPAAIGGHQGKYLADSLTGDPKKNAWDVPRGKLTSEEFTIERRSIRFRIGGGSHQGKTCMNLLLDGKVVRSATGENSEQLAVKAWDVEEFHGRKARLQIVDDHSGPWGHVMVDEIVLTDMASETIATGVSSIGMLVDVRPGGKQTVTLVLAWYFPNRPEGQGLKNYYATQWASADEVARYTLKHLPRLQKQTRLFQETFFSSTLPGVVEEAVSSQLAVLRSPTVFRLDDGAMYGWEGCGPEDGCCQGTCTHVWHYVQSIAYLFPAVERQMREVDYRYRLRQKDGHMAFRLHPPYKYQPENPAGGYGAAADGQFGTVLRVYREWQISGDTEWLRELWPGVKKSIEYAWVAWDQDRDGLMEHPRHNTLDLDLYGHETFCGSMYLVALLAGEKMAQATGDPEAAHEYRRVFESGSRKTDAELFNGEYYIQTLPEGAATRAQYLTGCCSEQLIGQWWSDMMGLGNLYNPANMRKAIASVFRYNFLADCYNHANASFVFNLGDDAGVLICSWPRGNRPPQGLFYADTFMVGYEDQVAANLIYHGYLLEGLCTTKAIRDRHDGRKRNPYNEFQCGSYYARAMANYSSILALSGFHYSGVDQTIQIDPQLNRDDFRTFFSVEGGYGTISQNRSAEKFTAAVELARGTVNLKKLILRPGGEIEQVMVRAGNTPVEAVARAVDGLVEVTLSRSVNVSTAERLQIELLIR